MWLDHAWQTESWASRRQHAGPWRKLSLSLGLPSQRRNSDLQRCSVYLIASSILVLNGGTLQAGSDNDTDAIGAKGGLVTIHLWGANNVAGPNCQDQNGNDDIYCGVDPTIFTKNQMAGIYPGSCQPNPDDPQGDCFYQYDVDKADLPGGYFGRKVLAVS